MLSASALHGLALHGWVVWFFGLFGSFAWLLSVSGSGSTQPLQKLAGRRIVFSANVTGNYDLYQSKSDGSAVQLTTASIDELSPAISPDGSMVVYTTSDGRVCITQIASRKNEELVLTHGNYGHPAWLRDGSGVVFTKYDIRPPDEDSDLYVYTFKDRQMRLFLKQTGMQDYPAISPDGNKVAYVSSSTILIPGLSRIVSEQLWVASLNEGTAAPLFPSAAKDRQPSWSPDGKHLAFSSDRSGKENIWIADLGGHELRQLTTDPASATSSSWSPDGKQIVYVSTASGRSELMIIDVESRATRRISPFGSQPVEIRDPQWH